MKQHTYSNAAHIETIKKVLDPLIELCLIPRFHRPHEPPLFLQLHYAHSHRLNNGLITCTYSIESQIKSAARIKQSRDLIHWPASQLLILRHAICVSEKYCGLSAIMPD